MKFYMITWDLWVRLSGNIFIKFPSPSLVVKVSQTKSAPYRKIEEVTQGRNTIPQFSGRHCPRAL